MLKKPASRRGSLTALSSSGDLHRSDHALEFVDPVPLHQARHRVVRIVEQRLGRRADHMFVLPVDRIDERRPGQGRAQLRQQAPELDQRLGED